jgi:hypothetical protein
MLHEIDIGCGYSIRVFDDAAQLASAVSYCQSYAFVVCPFDQNMCTSLTIIASSAPTLVLSYGLTAWTL